VSTDRALAGSLRAAAHHSSLYDGVRAGRGFPFAASFRDRTVLSDVLSDWASRKRGGPSGVCAVDIDVVRQKAGDGAGLRDGGSRAWRDDSSGGGAVDCDEGRLARGVFGAWGNLVGAGAANELAIYSREVGRRFGGREEERRAGGTFGADL